MTSGHDDPFRPAPPPPTPTLAGDEEPDPPRHAATGSTADPDLTPPTGSQPGAVPTDAVPTGPAPPTTPAVDEPVIADEATREDTSAKDTASEEAGRLKDVTASAASGVAGTAKDETKRVAGDAREQARNLIGEAQTQVTEQANSQRDRAVSGLRSLTDELDGMAENSEQSGLGTQLARQGSDFTRQAADFLEQREPGQLLEEVRQLARRRPGAFLIGAGIAGVLVGRMTRGAVAARKDDDSAGGVDTGPSGDGAGYETDGYGVAVGPVPPVEAQGTGYVETGYVEEVPPRDPSVPGSRP